ncbi:hypothetical protein JKY72_03095 [Candidatus Gracilibacteria bacterium]|nr:hypothetical protein [Candidatus Gracilibacteria bacterium]
MEISSSAEKREALEAFGTELAEAVVLVEMMGDSDHYFQMVEGFENVEDDPEALEDFVYEIFVSDPKSPTKTYSITGEAGPIQVVVFPTQNPNVFLGRYTHPGDNHVDWCLRPLISTDET